MGSSRGGLLGGGVIGQIGRFATNADPLGLFASGQAAPGYTPSGSYGTPEQQSGIKPPDFESIRDTSGNLKSGYSYDPYAGQAQQALKDQAFAPGQSPWAQMQLQQQGLEQQGATDLANRQNLQAMGQGQAELARFGGLGGGARERLARGGARNLMMANQDIARQGIGQRLGIGQQDLQRKQDLLGQFASAEGQAQQGNIGLKTGDIANKQAFDINRYNEQMRAWAANKSADAQAQAAASAGGGKK